MNDTYTVLTMGTFDLFHAGHVELLRESARLAWEGNYHVTGVLQGIRPRVVVGLNKDSFVERFKGRAPIMTYAEREAVLLACRYVDGVVPNLRDEDASACIEMVRPDIITVESGWGPDEKYFAQLGERARDYCTRRNVPVVYIPRAEPHTISTTIIRQRVLAEYGELIRRASTSG